MRALALTLLLAGLGGCGVDDEAPAARPPLAGWSAAEVSPGASWLLPKNSEPQLAALVLPLALGGPVAARSAFRITGVRAEAERAEIAISDGPRTVTLILYQKDVAGGIVTTQSFQIRIGSAGGLAWEETLAIAGPVLEAIKRNDHGGLWVSTKTRAAPGVPR